MITQTHLLVTETSGQEYVMRYEPTEMEEVFTAAERRLLGEGKPVTRTTGFMGVRFIDMIAACRLVHG